MSDLLRRGQEWLSKQLTEFASRDVVYQRDEQQVTLKATIGRTRGEQDVGDGLLLQTEIRDYLIDADELKLDGILTLPRRGDHIIEQESDKTFVYEVLPIGDQKAWRYSDPFRLKLRIHTKLISRES